jgi:hypothetical protein
MITRDLSRCVERCGSQVLTTLLITDEVELRPGVVEQLLEHLVRIVLIEQ